MYHFIVNPIAKGGKLKKEWMNLQKAIDEKIPAYEVHFTEYPGHSTEIVKSLTDTTNPITIIAVGGDGTINEIINGIVNVQITSLGYIPFGSGMDFARGNNIPLSPLSSINLIAEGNIKRIKFSSILVDNQLERRFASNCGIGFDAEVSAEASIEKTRMKRILNKINLGTLTYTYLVIKQLFSFNRLQIDLNVDGKSFQFDNAWFVTFSNNPYLGGGMKMNPTANPSEMILDSTIASSLSSRQVLALFPSIYKGTHIHHPGIKLLKGKEYKVSSNRPVDVHVDGEVIGKYTNFTIRLQNEWLNVLS